MVRRLCIDAVPYGVYGIGAIWYGVYGIGAIPYGVYAIFSFLFIFSAGFSIFSRHSPTIYYLLYYLLLFSSFACTKPPVDAPPSRAINSTPLPCHPFVLASERKSRR